MPRPKKPVVTRTPRGLVDAISQRKCVLFVGSGVSTSAGLPSWDKLLEYVQCRLTEEQLLVGKIIEAKKLLNSKRYLELADCFNEQAGRALLHRILNEKIDGNRVPLGNMNLQRALLALPYAGIVTTNYDNLIERVWSERTGTQLRVYTNRQTKELAASIFEGNQYLFKAHGDLSQSDSIVFAARDYQKIVHSNPGFRAILSSILVNYCVLFVGYSLTDPDFRLLLEKNVSVFEGFGPRHFAFVRNPGKMEIQLMLRLYGITVVSYSDHDDLIPMFETMQIEFSQSVRARETSRVASPV